MAKMTPHEGRMEYGTLSTKGRLTIPASLREALDLREGDRVLFRIVGDRLEIVPMALVPRDQAWFYDPEMQARVVEAERDIAAGRVTRVTSEEELDVRLNER